MTWKNCLVECATLFHNKFHQFMQKYIRFINGVIVKVAQHVI